MSSIRKVSLAATLLLSGGLLAGCVSLSDYNALKDQNTQLEAQLAQQQQQLSAANAQVARLQGAIKYTVNSDLLFAPGSWRMTSRGQQLIAQFAEKLAPDQTNKLVVAGYTDNTPIGPALRAQGVTSNEELSQKRAEAVMQFLVSQGVKPDLVSAKGFGDANPVASNDTAAGRAKNRRVDISLASA